MQYVSLGGCCELTFLSCYYAGGNPYTVFDWASSSKEAFFKSLDDEFRDRRIYPSHIHRTRDAYSIFFPHHDSNTFLETYSRRVDRFFKFIHSKNPCFLIRKNHYEWIPEDAMTMRDAKRIASLVGEHHILFIVNEFPFHRLNKDEFCINPKENPSLDVVMDSNIILVNTYNILAFCSFEEGKCSSHYNAEVDGYGNVHYNPFIKHSLSVSPQSFTYWEFILTHLPDNVKRKIPFAPIWRPHTYLNPYNHIYTKPILTQVELPVVSEEAKLVPVEEQMNRSVSY